jgi:ABC-type transport system involved in Fe-S cluster assembly fused permease/ATPase subunit
MIKIMLAATWFVSLYFICQFTQDLLLVVPAGYAGRLFFLTFCAVLLIFVFVAISVLAWCAERRRRDADPWSMEQEVQQRMATFRCQEGVDPAQLH